MRDMPYFAFQLGCYDNARSALLSMQSSARENNKPTEDGRNDKSISERRVRWTRAIQNTLLNDNAVDIMASMFSGVVTGVITNPMDVVTTRFMGKCKRLSLVV
jgi:hypothetical protein